MRSTVILFVLAFLTVGVNAQEFTNGTIITQRYDTISNVQIKVLNDSKSLLHLSYIDHQGNEQNPPIKTIKCYTRGKDVFCRVYNSGEMILVKQLVQGVKLNLYSRIYNGSKIYYIEKVYDEIIKVPSSNGKFRKVIGAFLSDHSDLSNKIKSKALTDIHEIVKIYNGN